MKKKRCTKCGAEKPLEEYHRKRASADGLQSRCKACSIEWSRAYTAANPERVAEVGRAYRAANRERVAEAYRAWREANREREAETNRNWINNNPQRFAEIRRRASANSRANHPGRIAARRAVNNAVRDGKMPPARDLPCSVCGASAEEYHHHLGYAPEHKFDVIAVCVTCHKELHREVQD